MASLLLKDIKKVYKNGFKAVKNVNLEIKDKEFLVLVGPSGCGKSTILRMIAGLENISKGKLFIDDVLVNDMEPKDRNIAMVFQNYALYPHMTVFDNMSFGLKIRKMDKKKIKERVYWAAEILGIKDLLSRKPSKLSGGQRQRVALGRAIVRDPKVFLMDEPLSNLDAKLRVQTRAEIIKLHQKLNTTFIYVTHDQTEAMTMGSRIVVIKDGDIKQVDTPQNIYNNPADKFVASFIGSPQMNFLECEVIDKKEKTAIKLGGSIIYLDECYGNKLKKEDYLGKQVTLGVRPEDITFNKEKSMNKIVGKVDFIEYLGSENYIYMSTEIGNLVMKSNIKDRVFIGEEKDIYFNVEKIHFFDKETEKKI